jgi:glycosyltransferase involved in cell wall biosynthesis
MGKKRYLYHEGEKVLLISDHPIQSQHPYVLVPNELEIKNPADFIVRDGNILPSGKLLTKDLRIAMISDYGINCGIATYTKYLCDAMRPLVKELKIFAEDVPEGSLPQDKHDFVARCWDRRGDYSRIIPLMKEYNPDLIFIQHEFGLFHKIDLWNALLSQLSRWRTIPVFHTVLDHNVPSPDARKDYMTRSLAEAACHEMIVHTPRARSPLRDRGYSGQIHYIPHGCFPPNRDNKLPSTRYGLFSEHSIFQYGFGATHKGWEIAIDVVEILKEKYPDLIYVGVFNLSDFDAAAQTEYHKKLLDIILSRGLEKNVAIHRGYQSEAMLANFIKSSRVAFFPYQVPNKNWTSWGASGAIQLPLSLGIPMVLSDFPVFQEFSGMLPLCKDAKEAAKVIDKIFSDKDYEKELSNMSFQLSESRSWDKVARWYLSCPTDKDFNAPCGLTL